MNNHICVGGPKAGQRVQTKAHCFRVSVPLMPPQPSGFNVSHPAERPVELSYVEYRRQTFYTEEIEGEHITVWAPSNQSARQTLELLVETYEIYRTRRMPL